MCATCGCDTPRGLAPKVPVPGRHQDEHHHHHEHHDHDHHHHHHEPPRVLDLAHRVLAHNDHLAGHNRAHFAAQQISAYNLMSSPGAGKTSLLERTIRELGRPVHVIEGDQETEVDAERIRAAGATAVQVNTGTGCHLDAAMVERALPALSLPRGALLLIENVGNLVCPALFDLGERSKVVIASVTEGEDKPLKYPHMFKAAGLVLLNKIDLLPWVPFDPAKFTAHLRRVNAGAEVLHVSALSGEGLDAWYQWLARGVEA